MICCAYTKNNFFYKNINLQVFSKAQTQISFRGNIFLQSKKN